MEYRLFNHAQPLSRNFHLARYSGASNPTRTLYFSSPTYEIDGVTAGNATCNCRKAHLDHMAALSQLGDESNAECSSTTTTTTTTTTEKPKTFLSQLKPCPQNTKKCNNNAKRNKCNTKAKCEKNSFCRAHCKKHCFYKGSMKTGCYKVLYDGN